MRIDFPPPPEPQEIVQIVESYVDDEVAQIRKHSQRQAHDEDGMHGLHTLVATVYAKGYQAGAQAERERVIRARFRASEAKR